jgi:hypothetical protein
MKAGNPFCSYCRKPFEPSPFHPKQAVCLSPACQRRWRSDYHRSKMTTDAAYRQQWADSRKAWRESHPDYQRHYRETHEAYTEQNRAKQRRRNQKRKLALIVKNNVLRIGTEASYIGITPGDASDGDGSQNDRGHLPDGP